MGIFRRCFGLDACYELAKVGGRPFLVAEKVTHRKRIAPYVTRRSGMTALPCAGAKFLAYRHVW